MHARGPASSRSATAMCDSPGATSRRGVERCASALHAAGVTEGDRVLWLGQNSFRVQELLLACARLGALFCPVELAPTARRARVRDRRPRTRRRGHPTGRSRRRGCRPACAWLHTYRRAPSCTMPTVPTPTSRSSRPPSGLADEPATASDDPLLLIYTAAFSGRPNAAMLPHRALIAQALLSVRGWASTAAHRYLNAGPMFHIGVFMENLATFQFGGTNVFVRRSDGDALCGARRALRLHEWVPRRPDGRRDRRGERRIRRAAPLRPVDLARQARQPHFDAWVQTDDSPWGRAPAGMARPRSWAWRRSICSPSQTRSARTAGRRR